MSPPEAEPQAEKAVMVFDGECRFCRFWIQRWEYQTAGRVEYKPFQEVAGEYPQIPRADFERAVQFITPTGAVSSGADAVFDALDTPGNRTGLSV